MTTTQPTITLDQLIAKIPVQFQPWASQYGPAFLAMTVAEFQAWIDLIIQGDIYAAYRQIIAKLPGKDAYLASLDTNAAAWKTQNAANNASIALQKQALTGLGSILLTIGLAAFGF
jgi:hypothetical protein